MNSKLRNAGLIALAAGVLSYPAWMLYRYVANRRNAGKDQDEENHVHKAFAPKYRSIKSKRRHMGVGSDGRIAGGLA